MQERVRFRHPAVHAVVRGQPVTQLEPDVHQEQGVHRLTGDSSPGQGLCLIWPGGVKDSRQRNGEREGCGCNTQGLVLCRRPPWREALGRKPLLL